MVLWRDWLPSQIVDASCKNEPKQFSALSFAVETEWNLSSKHPAADDSRCMTWIPVIDMYIKSKGEFAAEDLQRLVRVGLEVIQQSNDDIQAQVKWAACVSRILRKHRFQLSLEIHWRPLFDTLRRLYFGHSSAYQGGAVLESHRDVFGLSERQGASSHVARPARFGQSLVLDC
eukprot:CAMPEP_0117654528 /NCGR_PEP_ID=MMETSP0804-20121206/3792_1 /TAXON_ID=1074897 /ORGANISM="Tetraselmis astigmatica, Strain CCMP880" /LENGTH=173 /DNA_ID=CAMNT_0005460815 /DNA_START=139 /DNA_END=657 /DNA_ORIENTATION=+